MALNLRVRALEDTLFGERQAAGGTITEQQQRIAELEGELEQLREDSGVTALEQQLRAAEDEIARLQAQLLQTDYTFRREADQFNTLRELSIADIVALAHARRLWEET